MLNISIVTYFDTYYLLHWFKSTSLNNFLATSIDEPHLAEFKASAIAEDIIELNFRSWNPSNENDLDEVFTLLVSEPEHQNNGTLAGRANEQLANTLRSGGWRTAHLFYLYDLDADLVFQPSDRMFPSATHIFV